MGIVRGVEVEWRFGLTFLPGELIKGDIDVWIKQSGLGGWRDFRAMAVTLDVAVVKTGDFADVDHGEAEFLVGSDEFFGVVAFLFGAFSARGFFEVSKTTLEL